MSNTATTTNEKATRENLDSEISRYESSIARMEEADSNYVDPGEYQRMLSRLVELRKRRDASPPPSPAALSDAEVLSDAKITDAKLDELIGSIRSRFNEAKSAGRYTEADADVALLLTTVNYLRKRVIRALQRRVEAGEKQIENLLAFATTVCPPTPGVDPRTIYDADTAKLFKVLVENELADATTRAEKAERELERIGKHADDAKIQNDVSPAARVWLMSRQIVHGTPARLADAERMRKPLECLITLAESNKRCITGEAKGDPNYWRSFQSWIDKGNAALADAPATEADPVGAMKERNDDGWVSVEEQRPTYGAIYLWSRDDDWCCMGCIDANNPDEWVAYPDANLRFPASRFTHYQPLPGAPKRKPLPAPPATRGEGEGTDTREGRS